MIGIIHQLTDSKILAIIPDVTKVTENSITGKTAQVKGIDPLQAGFVLVEPAAVNITHEDITRETTLVEFVDGLPIEVPSVEVIGIRELIKIVLTKDGLEIGIGDTLNLATVTDVRDQLPLTPEQTKDKEIADLRAQLAETQNAINFLLGL